MDDKFTLEFDSRDINIIFDALQDKPYRTVVHVITEIQQQIQVQQLKRQEPIEAEERPDGE